MVQCISASCNTSSTRWVHRSPEGYINNSTEEVWRLHRILLVWEAERRYNMCVCVCVHCEFFISVARRLTWFPRLFQPHIQYTDIHTHTILNTRTLKKGDGGNDIKAGKDMVWASTDEFSEQTSFSRRMTWMDAHSWDSCVNKHQEMTENRL